MEDFKTSPRSLNPHRLGSRVPSSRAPLDRAGLDRLATGESNRAFTFLFVCVCSSCSSCSSLPHLPPFPRTRPRIREHRATLVVVATSYGISSLWLPRIHLRFVISTINSKISQKIAPIRFSDRSLDLVCFDWFWSVDLVC